MKGQKQITIMGTRHTISDVRRRCIIEATIEPLTPYRRGFARSKAGPFFELQTVHGLIKSGALRIFHSVRGRSRIMVTARAAL